MLARFAIFAFFALSLAFGPASAAALRASIEAQGAAVTLGDVFEGAGAAANRPIAPAPAPGGKVFLSAAFLSAAAEAAGLNWTPPDGLRQVEVRGRAVPARTASAIAVRDGEAPFTEAKGEVFGVRKGETLVLSYAAPGVRLSLRARALSPARVGESLRVLNLQSNREIDAIVTGPGAARALNPLQ